MKSNVLWLILVALVAAAIGRWSAPSAEAALETRPGVTPVEAMETTPNPAPRPEPADSARPGTAPVAPEFRLFVPPEAPAPGARGLGFDPTNFLAGLSQQLDQTADLARGGDAGALGELADWLDYCKQAERAVRSSGYVPEWAPNSESFRDATIQQYFKQVNFTCVEWIKRHPLLEAEAKLIYEANRNLYAQMQAGTYDPKAEKPTSLPQSLRRRAIESGDLMARSRFPQEPPCVRPADNPNRQQQLARVREYSACIYQARLEVLRRVLATRDPRVIAATPQILSMQWYGATRAQSYLSGDALYNEALWQLAACSLGFDCSASGPQLRSACGNGYCGYRSSRDYFADQRLTPATMRRVDAAMPGLINAIQSGNLEAILGPPPPP